MTTKKTVLITGASAGIGKATAEKLLAEGCYTVYVAARRLEKMQDLAELGARPVPMDITKDDQIVAAVERVEEEAGGVDVLINNAGFGLNAAMEDVPMDKARYQFEVNLFGLGRLTQLVLPGMREKKAGTIVNITSAGGKVYMPLGSWYIATKHALEGWSDCLRLELKPFGIDVIIVEPGAIATEFEDVMSELTLEISGETAYGPQAQKLVNMTRGSIEAAASPPSVIADTIAKALRSSRPKTRYAAGKYAKPMLFFRHWLSDRMFDRLMLNFMNKSA